MSAASTPTDLETMGEGNAALTHIGKTGLERYYEEALRGKVGYEQIETNVDGRPMRQVGHVPATPGADLRLSIDLDLQQAMVTAFGDMDGSAVAMDPRTGEILGMVSLPGYDANLFVNGISNVDYRALMDNPSRPLFNRNVLGGGPPGSTVKPLIGLAGLDSGLRTPESKVFSTGTFYIPGQRRGWRDAHGGAGWTDLRKSISASVNFYYYKLAYDMGIERFDQYMRKYGFGEPTGIDLLGEKSGVVPSPAWKRTRSKEPWYAGETVNAGIGQGYWMATVLQLVRGTAAIANGGNLVRPHLVAERRDGYAAPWTPLPQPTPGAHHRQPRQPARRAGGHDRHGPRRRRHRARNGHRRAVPDGRQDRHRAEDQPQGQRAASTRTTCPTTCATRRCSSAMRLRTTRPSWWRSRSSTAASAAARPRRSRARSSTPGCWARCPSRCRPIRSMCGRRCRRPRLRPLVRLR